jgi:hypothetical protein
MAQTQNKRFLLVFVLPLVSCICSSMVGIVLGQIGNIVYAAMGEAGSCLSIPGLCGLFLLTVGVSYLINMLMRNWFVGSGR